MESKHARGLEVTSTPEFTIRIQNERWLTLCDRDGRPVRGQLKSEFKDDSKGASRINITLKQASGAPVLPVPFTAISTKDKGAGEFHVEYTAPVTGVQIALSREAPVESPSTQQIVGRQFARSGAA